MHKLNIMIIGVGGQGTLLASRVIGNVALKRSYDVKMSEVHGMAQRGGSVVTNVKIAEKVYSPIIEKQEADIVLAFEKLEALRWVDYLKPGGTMIINDQEIAPIPVIIGQAEYPKEIINKIKDNYENIISINALSIAKECGTIKAVNTVLIGLMASLLDIPKEEWLESINENVPEKFIDVNLKAFEEGYNYSSKILV
ncbi:indolepyruvate oxidoreductase subunit beta [Natronospora cellulosivora (SeqCode)]